MCSTCLDRSDTALTCRHWATVRSLSAAAGVPPMLGCVRTAVEKGAQAAAILGFRNKGAVILEGDFRDECETFVTTDDGTYARHGFVTDALKEQVAGATAWLPAVRSLC